MKFNRNGEKFVFHDCKWTELWRDRKGTEGARQSILLKLSGKRTEQKIEAFLVFIWSTRVHVLTCALSFSLWMIAWMMWRKWMAIPF